MKLTSKGRYAVTALLDVAINGTEAPVALAEISKRQEISLSYLEQLFAKLRAANIVKSVRGPGGGYTLNMDPNDITVTSVIDAVNDSISATRCSGLGTCHADGKQCLTHALWCNLSDKIREFLDDISLGQLMKEQGHSTKAAKGSSSSKTKQESNRGTVLTRSRSRSRRRDLSITE